MFEAKFDGFCAAADTVRGRLISCNGNRMQRFEEVAWPLADTACLSAMLSCSTTLGVRCLTSCYLGATGRSTSCKWKSGGVPLCVHQTLRFDFEFLSLSAEPPHVDQITIDAARPGVACALGLTSPEGFKTCAQNFL